MRAGCLRIAIRSVYAGIQSTNGLNTMRPKQDYRISEPLHTIGKGWRTGNPRSKTSKVMVFLLALIAGYASAQSAKPLAQVPEKLKPGADESLAMIVAAKGVQIYECRAKKEQGGDYEWAFVAPEAELFDAVGSRIGKHYAGPTWSRTMAARSRAQSRKVPPRRKPARLPGCCSRRSRSVRQARSASSRACSA